MCGADNRGLPRRACRLARRVLVGLVAVLGVVLSEPAAAQSTGQFTAGAITADASQQVFAVSGPVVAEFGQQSLQAGRIVFNRATGRLLARGGVTLRTGSGTSQSEVMEITGPMRDFVATAILSRGASPQQLAMQTGPARLPAGAPAAPLAGGALVSGGGYVIVPMQTQPVPTAPVLSGQAIMPGPVGVVSGGVAAPSAPAVSGPVTTQVPVPRAVGAPTPLVAQRSQQTTTTVAVPPAAAVQTQRVPVQTAPLPQAGPGVAVPQLTALQTPRRAAPPISQLLDEPSVPGPGGPSEPRRAPTPARAAAPSPAPALVTPNPNEPARPVPFPDTPAQARQAAAVTPPAAPPAPAAARPTSRLTDPARPGAASSIPAPSRRPSSAGATVDPPRIPPRVAGVRPGTATVPDLSALGDDRPDGRTRAGTSQPDPILLDEPAADWLSSRPSAVRRTAPLTDGPVSDAVGPPTATRVPTPPSTPARPSGPVLRELPASVIARPSAPVSAPVAPLSRPSQFPAAPTDPPISVPLPASRPGVDVAGPVADPAGPAIRFAPPARPAGVDTSRAEPPPPVFTPPPPGLGETGALDPGSPTVSAAVQPRQLSFRPAVPPPSAAAASAASGGVLPRPDFLSGPAGASSATTGVPPVSIPGTVVPGADTGAGFPSATGTATFRPPRPLVPAGSAEPPPASRFTPPPAAGPVAEDFLPPTLSSPASSGSRIVPPAMPVPPAPGGPSGFDAGDLDIIGPNPVPLPATATVPPPPPSAVSAPVRPVPPGSGRAGDPAAPAAAQDVSRFLPPGAVGPGASAPAADAQASFRWLETAGSLPLVRASVAPAGSAGRQMVQALSWSPSGQGMGSGADDLPLRLAPPPSPGPAAPVPPPAAGPQDIARFLPPALPAPPRTAGAAASAVASDSEPRPPSAVPGTPAVAASDRPTGQDRERTDSPATVTGLGTVPLPPRRPDAPTLRSTAMAADRSPPVASAPAPAAVDPPSGLRLPPNFSDFGLGDGDTTPLLPMPERLAPLAITAWTEAPVLTGGIDAAIARAPQSIVHAREEQAALFDTEAARRERWNPDLEGFGSAGIRYGRLEDDGTVRRSGAVTTPVFGGVRAQLPLYDSGRRQAREQVAAVGIGEAHLAQSESAAETAAAVRIAFIEFQAASAYIASLRIVEERFVAILGDAERQYAARQVTSDAMEQARAFAVTLATRIDGLEQERAQADLTWRSLTGLGAIDSSGRWPTLPAAFSSGALQTGIGESPRLGLALAELERRGHERTLTESAGGPQLGLAGRAAAGTEGEGNLFVGLVATVPLFDNGVNAARVAAVDERIGAAEAAVLAQRDALSRAVTDRNATLRRIGDRDVALNQVLNAAREHFNQALRRARGGIGEIRPITVAGGEVVRALQQRYDATLAAADAHVDVIRLLGRVTAPR